jgi:hypothetical protein
MRRWSIVIRKILELIVLLIEKSRFQRPNAPLMITEECQKDDHHIFAESPKLLQVTLSFLQPECTRLQILKEAEYQSFILPYSKNQKPTPIC